MHIRFSPVSTNALARSAVTRARVPRSIARRGIHGISAMTVMGATRERGFGQPGGPGLTNLTTSIGRRAETMEGYRICAKCGVDNFTQRPVHGS